jgi:putative transposase
MLPVWSSALAREVMTIPYRGTTGDSTYFVTASTCRKKALLQSERMATLFTQILFEYRDRQKYQLYEFVVMPDHFHLLVSPIVSLERAIQFIKGGFSFQAGRLFKLDGAIWQDSFYDRRVRDFAEYEAFSRYIHWNPVKRKLASNPAQYAYSSACGKFQLNSPPQGLKPLSSMQLERNAKALLHP